MFDAALAADPYPLYARLRAAGPLHWVESFRGGAWLVPRHVDVAQALRDPRLSSRRSHTWAAALPEATPGEFDEFNRMLAQSMLFLDRPQHDRVRKLMNKNFTTGAVEEWRPHIRGVVDQLLDRVTRAGRMDFIADFAYPLPAEVISELLGVPVEDRSSIKGWADEFAAFFGNPRPTLAAARAVRGTLFAVRQYFQELFERRRRQPGDDVMSRLVDLEEDGDVLTAEELLAQCSLLLFAGHETTRNLLGSGLLALLQHPDQMDLLKGDPPSLMPAAVREFLRYDSPVQFLSRVAVDDISLHGRTVQRGQTVVLLIGSANRDPDRFADPDALDITRSENSSLAFGHGAHYCLGAPLATVETEIALQAVLDRLPGLQLGDEQPSWRATLGLRGLERLPVTFTAQGAQP